MTGWPPASDDDPRGPLLGVRVLDLSRLAPGPYATMLLADLGADVVSVVGGRPTVTVPEFGRGKRSVALDLKSEGGRDALHRLVADADVVVEGFRPGVAERMGAGYGELAAVNPRLVYCSVTGFGHPGPRSRDAGHDINYLALSGVLAGIGPAAERPYPPLNLLADFAGGSLFAVVGILAALAERTTSGRGQRVDVAMVDGAYSLLAMHLGLWRTGQWPARGRGVFTGERPYYRTYGCADGRFVAVGALEPEFFAVLWRGLGLGAVPDHLDPANAEFIAARLSSAFAQHPRDHWSERFLGTDACVTPVLDPDEVWKDPQFRSRHDLPDARTVPAVPAFGRTPGRGLPSPASMAASPLP